MSPKSPFRLVLTLCVLAVLSACGSGSGGGGGGFALGSLSIQHNLATPGLVIIEPDATEFVFTGLNADGIRRFGPVSLPRASEHLLTDVPSDVVSLAVEYRTPDGSLHAAADVPVRVPVGGTANFTAHATKSLAIQLINESGLPDTDVYVLLSANGEVTVDTDGGALAVYRIGTGSTDVISKPLSDLTKVGTRTSSLTGKTTNVYELKPTRVVSGRLWVSYGAPLTYKEGDLAPDNFAPSVRYDKMEMGYNPASGDLTGFFDLTSVDFFAIPMQLEVLANAGDATPFRVTTFYTSTMTLLKAFFELDPSTMAEAFYKTGAPPVKGWDPTTDSLDTFVRAMSPATLVSQAPAVATDPFTAAPYPSFINYLTELANTGAYVDLEGANGVDGGALTKWAYRAAITSDGAGGFLVTCRPTAAMDNPPEGSLGDPNYPDNPSLTKDLTVEVHLSKKEIDQFIYGVPANAFLVKDLACHLSPYASNSAYADIAGDFLAGLNFGYVGGRYGNDASRWFEVLPGLAPYAVARPGPDDGYYNPYAAVLYNLTDSYSYSISDRLAVGNPLVTTSPEKPNLRITILPDERLDAPQNVQVAPGSDGTSLDVTWDAIATPPSGFALTGYRVVAIDGSVPVADPTGPLPTDVKLNEVLSPLAGQPPTTMTSATLTGLSPNTAYQISVIAEGTFNAQAVTSTRGNFAEAATPVAAPPAVAPEAAPFITFGVGISEPVGAPAGTTYTIDGMPVSNTKTQLLKRPKPAKEGDLVQALFEISGPDPANQSGPHITYAQTNVFLNAADAGDDASGNGRFNVYFNFPFSNAVPTATQVANLLDGSRLNFSYSPTFGLADAPQPPFGDEANSLVLTVAPDPTNRAKVTAPARVPSTTPVTPVPMPPVAPLPGYMPVHDTPAACPKFEVRVLLPAGSPLKLSDLEGSTVQFVRLVTHPGKPGETPQTPGSDGSGADAKLPLDDAGSATFDPGLLPYNAPIWNLGYRVDVIVHDDMSGTDTTYSAYGVWSSAAVGVEWKSGLTGETDHPGVIYVPLYSSPPGQVVWGN